MGSELDLQTTSHQRQNLLTGDWVLVSPQRMQRPWQGMVETPEPAVVQPYDAGCYLCPGNERAGGKRNPAYTGPFAFDNDFSALSANSAQEDFAAAADHPMLVAAPLSGCCRVVCYSARHDQHLSGMSDEELARVFAFLTEQFVELDRRPDIAYVQVFENRGQMMGCSNPHPHAQIWATSDVPVEPARELHSQATYFAACGRSLLMDYLAAEISQGSRIVCENDHAVALVPFWAVWPFETLLLPRRAMAGPEQMSAAELQGFAQVLKRTLRAYDALFSTSVPYSMGFHPRPSDGILHLEWQYHAHIYPPLLRSASVRKHLVGFEMLGMPQRDLTPEVAAARLRKACMQLEAQ
jgi:UDPglucose--hexose-1-phosphate uridylyltransferase